MHVMSLAQEYLHYDILEYLSVQNGDSHTHRFNTIHIQLTSNYLTNENYQLVQ